MSSDDQRLQIIREHLQTIREGVSKELSLSLLRQVRHTVWVVCARTRGDGSGRDTSPVAYESSDPRPQHGRGREDDNFPR